MNRATYLVGDVRDRLSETADDSIDLVLTSPPFLALRSYLPDDHPDKHREIGSESTPADFLTTLLALTGEFDRVLAPHGSIAVELGDTFSGSGGHGGDYEAGGLRDGQPKFDGAARQARWNMEPATSTLGRGKQLRAGGLNGAGWPLPKSLCMIPQLYAASLAYGRNLLTGEPCEPWRVRNWITWGRPNPPVGALGDKVRPASSFFTVACKSGRRWFDLDAVRTVGVEPGVVKSHSTEQHNPSLGWQANNARIVQNPNGAPPLDWWTDEPDDDLATALLIEATQPYKGTHYATWPEAVARRFVLMMCPERVCAECGEPSRRLTTTEQVPTRATNGRKAYPERGSMCENYDQRTEARTATTGWTDCGHDAWRAGVALDPFAGSGTTLAVAHRNGRDSIGIDLDPRNEALFHKRLAQHEGGLFLDDPTPADEQLVMTDTEGP